MIMSGLPPRALTIVVSGQAAGAIGAVEQGEDAVLAGDAGHERRAAHWRCEGPSPPASSSTSTCRDRAITGWRAGASGIGTSTTT